ncbi:hypothetical protein FA10DRAFT_300321 [Acaromyces ingoldii]|uniref:DNA-directed RNA polymerase III subunit RPC9 n=1 Tax=Acaromyces ingoldii TaxID=215250 RepID=A0A316YVH6_9BASI|nr:hypothetical protein FA10DRAFT_300321 [Acaromyces ingoldii]PWN91735.1 hypothetical protein FA10DRAFT_300321 [Acaromyces ingoldii]
MKVIDRRAALLSDFEVLSLMREMDQHHRSTAQRPSLVAYDDLQAPKEADDGPPTSLESVADEKALSSLPSNLRTIQYSVLEHLSSVQRPCAHQQPRHISSFLSALRRWERGYDVEGVTLSVPPEAVLGGEPSSGAEQPEGLFRGQEDLEESYEGDRTMGEVTMGGGQAEAGTSNSQPVPRVAKESRLTKGERLMLVNHAPMTLIELHCIVEEVMARFTELQMADMLALVAHFLPLDTIAIAADAERESNEGQAQQVSGEGEQEYYGQDEVDEVMEDDGNIYEEQLEALENEEPAGDAVGADGPDDD